MNKKYFIRICVLSFITICMNNVFSGCSEERPSKDQLSVPSPAVTEEADSSPAELPNHINMIFENGDQYITVDADVTSSFHTNTQIIALADCPDVVGELRPLLFPEDSPIQPLESGIALTDENGAVRMYLTNSGSLTTYENIEFSLNGAYTEPDYLFRYNVFSDSAPVHISFGPEEAADKVKQFFRDKSIFSFEPYKILAGDDNGQGYYTVYLRGSYETIPICVSANCGPGLGVHASVSDDGLFYFQGMFFLSETGRRESEPASSFESILEEFGSAFSLLAPSQSKTTIYHISNEYLLCNTDIGQYELRLGWCFYAAAETAEGFVSDWVFKYDPTNAVPWSIGLLM